MDAQEAFELLRCTMKAQGVTTRIYTDSLEDLGEPGREYDRGLHRRLNQDYDYAPDVSWFRANCTESWQLVNFRDPFGVSYILLRTVDDPDGHFYYILAGPYIDGEIRPDPESVAKRVRLGPEAVPVLQEHYYALPLLRDLVQVTAAFYLHLFPDHETTIVRKEMAADLALGMLQAGNDLPNAPKEPRNMPERYEAEERILRAVEKGDVNEAISAMRAFGGLHSERSFGDVESSRLWLGSLNDLFRRAVQRAQVHPAHINRVATYFGEEIRTADRNSQFTMLVDSMLRRYCDLVNTYSMQGYSQIIREVMNYVEFHLQEELDLQALADRFAVNASYLSRRFRQETGSTLTEYVNRKRIERAMALLITTDLPVSEISAAVGILDNSYFSRIFRKQTGMTPREYRSIRQHK